jgi:hypothetical protein
MLKLEFLDFWKMFMIIKDATIWFEINNMLFFFFVPATVKQKLQFKNLLRKQKMIWTILNHNVSSHDLPSLTWSKYIYTYCQLYHG